MRCDEIREYMFAFLDNELDAPLSIEFQHHIDHCAVCAREVEIERVVRGRLAGALGARGPDIPTSIQALERTLKGDESAAGRRRWQSRSVVRAVCAAAVLAAGIALYEVMHPGETAKDAPGFVSLLVRDFEHFLAEGRPIHFASSSADAVSDWLLQQTDLEVILPVIQGPNCRLLGARQCTIAGRPTAFVVYEMDQTPVSLLAMTSGSQGLKEMDQQVESDGRIFWVERVGETSIVAYRQNNLIYAGMSRLEAPELIHFFSGTANETH